MKDVIGFVVGIPILLLGFAIVGRVLSLKFFDDTGTVKVVKIFTLLAYMAGIGAAFVGKTAFAFIAIAIAAVGYWVLIKDKE